MLCCGLRIVQNCLKGQPEKTNLNIKCGKPIFVVSFKNIKLIVLATILLTLTASLFCLGIFVAAVKIKLNIGILINMISQNEGNFLPIVFAIPSLLCLFLNIGILYLLYAAFAPKQRGVVNLMMYIVVLAILIMVLIILMLCIVILAHVYASNEHLHNGIIDAMKNYSTQSDIKRHIDRMQIEYQCCGSKKYDEWYDIQWYDTNMMKPG